MVMDYYDMDTGTWRANPKYQEIIKLHQMLTNAEIPHVFHALLDGYQVIYPDQKTWVMDAIEHYGSYGRDDDKLEIMGLLTPGKEEHDAVRGDLTAEEVFERIRKHHSGEWDAYIYTLNDIRNTNELATEYNPSLTSNPPTPEEFAIIMKRFQTMYSDDEEFCHVKMDEAMCNLLYQLGYHEAIDIFNNTPKWYA